MRIQCHNREVFEEMYIGEYKKSQEIFAIYQLDDYKIIYKDIVLN